MKSTRVLFIALSLLACLMILGCKNDADEDNPLSGSTYKATKTVTVEESEVTLDFIVKFTSDTAFEYSIINTTTSYSVTYIGSYTVDGSSAKGTVTYAKDSDGNEATEEEIPDWEFTATTSDNWQTYVGTDPYGDSITLTRQ